MHISKSEDREKRITEDKYHVKELYGIMYVLCKPKRDAAVLDMLVAAEVLEIQRYAIKCKAVLDRELRNLFPGIKIHGPRGERDYEKIFKVQTNDILSGTFYSKPLSLRFDHDVGLWHIKLFLHDYFCPCVQQIKERLEDGRYVSSYAMRTSFYRVLHVCYCA
jgi:hypothetical protein